MNFVTCATPAYLARHGRPRHPGELAGHRAINYFASKTGKTYDWEFERGEERVDVPMPSCLAVNDPMLYLGAGMRDLGMMQLPTYMADPLLATGELELMLQDWTTPPLPIHVVYPQNRHLSAKVRVFVEWVAELFAADPRLHLKRT